MSSHKEHSSFFSYSLSKPYPFTWFTPVAVVGAIIGTAIFSVANLASNGYVLKTESTTNPQLVTSHIPWFASWSWDNQLRPTCQPQDISVGTQVFTSNKGFTYTLKSVAGSIAGSLPGQNSVGKFGSLSYLNTILDDCNVDSIRFELRKTDLSTSDASVWWSWDDSAGYGDVHCTVADSDNHKMNVTFQTQYKTSQADYSYVIQSDPVTDASMWWATRLLNAYWYSTVLALTKQRAGNHGSNFTDTSWTRATLIFRPNLSISDIKDNHFFRNPGFEFLTSNGNYWNEGMVGVNTLNLSLVYNNADYLPYSATLTQALSWAKIMYSALLVDLGQTKLSSSSSQNLLTNPDLLQYILQHPDDTFRNDRNNSFNGTHDCNASLPNPMPCYPWFKDINMFAPPTVMESTLANWDPRKNVSMVDSYRAFHQMMGPLGTQNATISMTYSCQVPRMKAIQTVILAVLVADLVFLQACWKILNLVATTLLSNEKRYPNAMRCHTCDGCGGELDDIKEVASDTKSMNIMP